MPKPTFFNLPAAKRDAIIELAIEEFSQNAYRQASLSRIVQRAGIAKGSIYQYFDNKLDLYRWLITEHIAARKMSAISAAAPPADASIWQVLEIAYLAGFRFTLVEPRLAALGTRFMRDASDPDVRAIAARNRDASDAWLRALVRGAIDAGDIRAELDVELAVGLLTLTLGEGMLELMARRLGLNLSELLEDPGATNQLTEQDVLELVRGVIGFLRTGLA